MGMAKRQMMEREEQLQWATGLLIEAGAASECENHGYVVDELDGGAAEEAAAQAAANPPKGLSATEAADLVREALTLIGYECPGCAKNAADD
ncbi:hypothetical protein GPL21_27015 [Bradyrhizobium pachyrhizi]|uniref:Uncharacterized protein n=1 Tax=Bradyrhizobium pachyrhizi TaxID=280333 RepID=A0A844SXE6_9BRAD|nr:hypothetical protein [Bradyrhizobium pachyrhizi]MVT68749.1 hypothetical protein [Bradyrhizobium pachyrhizi]